MLDWIEKTVIIFDRNAGGGASSLQLTLFTYLALVLFVPNMTTFVLQFIAMALKKTITKLAGEPLDALVFILVHLEGSSRSEGFGALIALEWTLIAVDV